MRLDGITKGENIKKNVSRIEAKTLLHHEALDMRKNQQKRLRRHEGGDTIKTCKLEKVF